ncbi:FkbM family methyltransferase [bacterium]|nr:FkbM family methyltransferase [bacterium]
MIRLTSKPTPRRSADLTGVAFVIAPGGFPRDVSYVLVRDAAFLADTLTFLQALAPTAAYRGAVPPDVRPGQVCPNDLVVVSSDHWYDVVAQLRAAGFAAGRLCVLLNTFNDGLGYLDVGRVCPDRIAELADPAVPVADKIRWFRPHLLRYGAADRFEGARPVWNPACYFTPYRDQVRANAAAVQDVTARLADQASREAYNLVLYGTPEELLAAYLPRVFHHQQYVEVGRVRPGDVIVNAGIGSGWDVAYLVAANRAAGRHILVDPVRLYTPGGPCGHLVDRLGLEFVDCGLWDREDELVFPVDHYGMVQSDKPVGPEYTGRVHRAPLRPLDALVREWGLDRLDFLKMDIEGADLRALHGMTDTLTRFRPQLAVCLYHDPAHMWEIPQLLMARLPDYDFYVRHYSYTRFECLLYAVPRERAADRPAARALDPIQVARTAEYLGLPSGADNAAADQAFWAGRAGAVAPVVELRVGTDHFLGLGWGDACEGRTGQTWRWVGPAGVATAYLDLDPARDHICRVLFHHAESQAAFDLAELDVNGRPAGSKEIGAEGAYFYVQWHIPAAAVATRNGRCAVRFRTTPGERQVALTTARIWPAS